MGQVGILDRSSDRHKGRRALPTEIALRAGETHILPLQGRGSAGYSWSCAVSGDRSAVEVRVENSGEPPDPSGRRPVAGSVPEQLVLKALSPGTVTIELAQQRSWEKDRPPLAKHIIVVSVTPK